VSGGAIHLKGQWSIIRNPQVHVPLPLTATCQLQELSLKAERNTYIRPEAAACFRLIPAGSMSVFGCGLTGKGGDWSVLATLVAPVSELSEQCNKTR
jgi:hypothetical protein